MIVLQRSSPPLPSPPHLLRAETATKTGMIMVLGEISTQAKIDFQQVIRDCIQQIGYDESNKGVCVHMCVFVSLSICVAGGTQSCSSWSLHSPVAHDGLMWFARVHWKQSLCGRHGWTGCSHHLGSMSLVGTLGFLVMRGHQFLVVPRLWCSVTLFA